jgi:hypothetical protein
MKYRNLTRSTPRALRVIGVLGALLMLATTAAYAQVQPGQTIAASNAHLVKELLSPGAYFAVMRGMEMKIVAPKRIEWPPPYRIATEQYSQQVRLAPDRRNILGYVAGQPFPFIDLNDPDAGTKIMWNSYFRPIATDDADLRFPECLVAPFNPGGEQKVMRAASFGHIGGYSNLGRTEVPPMPVDPDFKANGIWRRGGGYPLLYPSEERGTGFIRYRYWDGDRADDAWVYLPGSRRLRRLNEAILSSSPGLSTWDADHAGGFEAKPQNYRFKFIGEKSMLACVNAERSPARVCPTDGGATSCPENWEMRHIYIVEVTPRPERTRGVLHSKTVVYIDSELWFNPYVDSYDRRGELWKTQVYLLTYRDRPVPDARVAIYPFARQFVIAASSIDVQSGISTTCYLPSPNTPERECWYINMGAIGKDFFTREAIVRAGH